MRARFYADKTLFSVNRIDNERYEKKKHTRFVSITLYVERDNKKTTLIGIYNETPGEKEREREKMRGNEGDRERMQERKRKSEKESEKTIICIEKNCVELVRFPFFCLMIRIGTWFFSSFHRKENHVE